jgi:hypothetical protein
MKTHAGFALLIVLASCLSTEQVARNRNSDFREYNQYKQFQFWRAIDIARFTKNLANVHFAILAEGYTVKEMMEESYLRSIRDSLHTEIGKRNIDFQSLRTSYFDSTSAARKQFFYTLKSDSMDLIHLSEIKDSPYFELYQDLNQKNRKAILSSDFYRSQTDFEDYLRTRSFSPADSLTLNSIFNGQKVTRQSLSEKQMAMLRERDIDFLILYAVSYTSAYSEQAEARIGTENIDLICFFVPENKILCEVELIYFLGESKDGIEN